MNTYGDKFRLTTYGESHGPAVGAVIDGCPAGIAIDMAAIDAALAKVKETGNLSVPLPLRNAPTQLMKDLNYSDGYKYAHDYPGHFADMEFLPEKIKGTVLYEPQDNRHEAPLKAYLEACWPKYYGKK